MESAKNGLKKAQKLLIAAITANEEVIDRDGDHLVNELHAEPQQFSALSRQPPVVAHQRACNNLVQELAGIATIFSMSCNCGSRLSPPQPATEEPVRSAQQRH